MSEISNVAANAFYQGEDKILVIGPVVDENGAGVDVSGWGLSYVLQKSEKSATPLLHKVTSGDITITGTFSAVLASNTQRIEIAFFDEETNEFSARDYYHELKRTDVGLETVLMSGTFTLTQSARIHRD